MQCRPEESLGGGSDRTGQERKKPRPKDVFGRALPTEEEFEVLKNAPRYCHSSFTLSNVLIVMYSIVIVEVLQHVNENFLITYYDWHCAGWRLVFLGE